MHHRRKYEKKKVKLKKISYTFKTECQKEKKENYFEAKISTWRKHLKSFN